jgi:hypothetical protein
LLNKVGSTELRQLPVKRHQNQLLDAKRLQELELFFREIKAQAWLTVQHFPWMGPETHHRGDGIEVIRVGHRRDHPPMARMEPVEAAQRQGGGGLGLLWGAERNQRRCAQICG